MSVKFENKEREKLYNEYIVQADIRDKACNERNFELWYIEHKKAEKLWEEFMEFNRKLNLESIQKGG